METKNKIPHNNYNTEVVKELALMYGTSDRYVRACLKGDRGGRVSEGINKQYKIMCDKVANVLKSHDIL